jgi:hypothetical protein
MSVIIEPACAFPGAMACREGSADAARRDVLALPKAMYGSDVHPAHFCHAASGFEMNDRANLQGDRLQKCRRLAVTLASLLYAFALTALAPALHAAGHCYTAEAPDEAKSNPIEPLCRVLEANLNEFCDQPPPVCGIKITSRYAQELSLPQWTPVDLQGKLDLVESTVRAREETRNNRKAAQVTWNEEGPALVAALKAGRLSVKTTQLDLFNVGKALTVYRIDDGACPGDNRKVLRSRDPGVWDSGFHPWNVQVRPAREAYETLQRKYVIADAGNMGDVLLFKGKPYRYSLNTYQKDTRELNM